MGAYRTLCLALPPEVKSLFQAIGGYPSDSPWSDRNRAAAGQRRPRYLISRAGEEEGWREPSNRACQAKRRTLFAWGSLEPSSPAQLTDRGLYGFVRSVAK